MALSKKRDRLRKRRLAAKKRPTRLSKKDVRTLRAAGLDPERVVGEPYSEKVSGRVVNAIVRELEAKRARTEWQSGGIKMLHQEIATLKALLASQPVMQDTEVLQRLTQLEAQQALQEAVNANI